MTTERDTHPTPDALEAMATASEVGPFFQVDPWRDGAGWMPLGTLVSEPSVLEERVAAAQATIAGTAGVPRESVAPRVAASIVFLGLVARLTSPPLAAALLAGVVPQLTVEALWWRPVRSGPWPIAASPVAAVRVGDLQSESELAAAAQNLTEGVVVGVVGPLQEAFAERFRVSSQVLWGNVASGLGGALTMLAAARPDTAGSGAALVQRLLGAGPLRGTGQLMAPERSFVRRSCCLFYLVPGAGFCGDCVLRLRPSASRPPVPD